MDERSLGEASKDASGPDAAKAGQGRGPLRFQTLVALVVCVGALFWAYRTARDGMRPATGWAKQLRSGDVEDRQIAAQQLAESRPEDLELAIPALIAAMGDPEEPVRAEASTALGAVTVTALKAKVRPAEAREAARVLTKALGDPGAEVRMSATSALGDLAAAPNGADFPADPAEVASAVAGLLVEPLAMVRSRAETTLGRLAARAPIVPPSALIEGLNAWPLKESRASAAIALGSFKGGVGPTVDALIRALEDKEAVVRSEAALALNRIGPDAAPAVPVLVKALGDSFVPPPAPQFSVTSEISGFGGASGGSGGVAGQGTDPASQAVRALGRIAQSQAQKGDIPAADVLEGLVRAFHAGRPALSAAAQDALRRIGKGASAAIPALIQDLADATPKEGAGLGPAASALLGDIAPGTDRAGEAIATLTSALDAKEPRTRLAAAQGLARFGPAASTAVPRLRGLAEDKGVGADLATAAGSVADRIEGKAPPESARRKGRGRGAPGARP